MLDRVRKHKAQVALYDPCHFLIFLSRGYRRPVFQKALSVRLLFQSLYIVALTKNVSIPKLHVQNRAEVIPL